MKFFHQALLLLFLGCSTGKDICENDGIQNLDSTERIVGGKVARHGAYPWMVSLHAKYPKKSMDHVCGGAILNEDWIVTAAHCIDWPDDLWRYEVIVGMHNQATKHSPSLRRHKVSKFVLHEDYDNTTFENDIALIKTAEPIDIEGSNGYVSPINLPRLGAEPVGYAKVIRWGHTVENGKMSDKLLIVTVPIMDRVRCNEAYDDDPFDDVYEVTEDMMCAGTTRMDSCQPSTFNTLLSKNYAATEISDPEFRRALNFVLSALKLNPCERPLAHTLLQHIYLSYGDYYDGCMDQEWIIKGIFSICEVTPCR